MARNNPEVQTRVKNNNNNMRSPKYYGASPKCFKSITPPMSGAISPRVTTPPSAALNTSSPRTSPGLLAGHYAGCKFTEPPLPSALPLPPQHWMQQPHSYTNIIRPSFETKSPGDQLSQQLKVLLKVQA